MELHIVRRDEIETPESPGDETAGIDLGICNFAAVAYSTEEADLYPGNRLKQDAYYYPKEIAKCDDPSGDEAIRLHHEWSERRNHFFYGLANVGQCVEKSAGKINIGELSGVCENDGEAKDWGKHGNLDLHVWAFDCFTSILEYKAKHRGIEIVGKKIRVKRVVSVARKMVVSEWSVVCTCARRITMRLMLM